MKWWRRAPAKMAAGPPALDANVLVISDIHLGEDIVSTGPEHLGEYIRALNRELAEFIAAHRQRREAGRAWHLVINGDMFDFVKVSLRRDADASEVPDGRPPSRRATQTLPNTAENVVWKLTQILDIHRPLFKELAAFLLDGNTITIIEGNHDAEFYFAAVQEALRAHLVRLAEILHGRDKRPGSFMGGAVAERLQFRSWFEASPGRYHIEHGHQYDEFCSFEYKLAPHEKPAEIGVDQAAGPTLATPMSHRPVPYLSEVLGDFSTHGVSSWTAGDFWRFARSLGPGVVWALCRVYAVVAFELLSQAGGRRRTALQSSAARHRDALRALSQACPYGLSTLQRLDGLKAPPAEYSLVKMLHTFYLDRLLVAGMTSVCLAGVWAVGLGAQGLAMALGAGVTAFVGLSAWKRPDVRRVLRGSAAAIAEATGARYVVFGHSHAPEVVNLRRSFGVSHFGETSYYLNSGSWVTREILRGAAGSGMTYVEIGSRGAALMRWRGLDEPPLRLAGTEDEAGEASTDTVAPPPADGNGLKKARMGQWLTIKTH